jgi:hypothetical protein
MSWNGRRIIGKLSVHKATNNSREKRKCIRPLLFNPKFIRIKKKSIKFICILKVLIFLYYVWLLNKVE